METTHSEVRSVKLYSASQYQASISLNCFILIHLDLFCAPVSEMYSKKNLRKKLDIIKCFDSWRTRERGLCIVFFRVHYFYGEEKRILKAAKVNIGSDFSKLISFSRHPIMEESLSLEGIDECTKRAESLTDT